MDVGPTDSKFKFSFNEIYCLNLIFSELSIRNFPRTDFLVEPCMFHFRHLERLDLFRSNIESDVLLMVLKNNPKLKHLNLGNLNKFHSNENINFEINCSDHEQHFVN